MKNCGLAKALTEVCTGAALEYTTEYKKWYFQGFLDKKQTAKEKEISELKDKFKKEEQETKRK